jgi:hypothetical protein
MTAPAAALEASRVDLIAAICEGIPEPAFVPGCAPWLLQGKRYLVPAPAGTGKSLAAAVISVAIVEAGGTVAILDVENGADEYARRLQDILNARDPDGTAADACQARLRYHAWPTLSLAWIAGEWADALRDCQLVIFDSSRLMLSSVGLGEDKADDYSRFVTGLLIPLARAGITTMVLDNTGHDQERARGSSSKEDLNEVVYLLKRGAAFDRDRAGHLRMLLRRNRFASLPQELHLHVGADTYSAPVPAQDDGDDGARPFRPTGLMERVSVALEGSPGLSKRAIRETVRGKNSVIDLALELLVCEGFVEVIRDGRSDAHRSVREYREEHDPATVPRAPAVPHRAPGHADATVPRAPSIGMGHGARSGQGAASGENWRSLLDDERPGR